MAEGNYSPEPFDDETSHKQRIWEEFLVRSVEAGNRAIEWLELEDFADDQLTDSQLEEIYNERWQSTGDVVITCFNFLWPEIESLAIKLGVPFEPEVSEIYDI